jgi:NAD(P)-dependent dehydrogenase (short-subunit alcohol dehydrogenase family)
MEFTGKTALVTGAGALGGIGAATAALLAQGGASVLINGRDERRGNEVVSEISEAGGQARFILADLSRLDDVERLADSAGEVDILVNNHASYREVLKPTFDQQPEGVAETWDTNIRATFFLTARLARSMVRRRTGSVISISSIAGSLAMPNMSTYGAQKAALESLTRSWALEWGPDNVRVNAVGVGNTKSDAVYGMMGEELEVMATRTALKRIASTNEIAEVVAFLASERASYVTGATVAVDGGYTAV